MFKQILIPTDGSQLAQAAVRKGVEFAKTLGATVTIVTVSPPFELIAVDDPLVAMHTMEEYRKAEAKKAADILRAGEEYAKTQGVPCRTQHVWDDPPYLGITRAAKENNCDLICMASHGRRGIAALILGSETQKVLTHSTIPVLVWRG
jgi:nucleotide-binding universal stress UspA family protein